MRVQRRERAECAMAEVAFICGPIERLLGRRIVDDRAHGRPIRACNAMGQRDRGHYIETVNSGCDLVPRNVIARAGLDVVGDRRRKFKHAATEGTSEVAILVDTRGRVLRGSQRLD